MCTLVKIWILGALSVMSWEDLHTQWISGRWLGLFGIMGLPVFFLRLMTEGRGCFVSLIPGLLFVVISAGTRESLGAGDAAAVLELGLFLTIEALCLLLAVSMTLIMIWAGILWIKEPNRRKAFPMIPFLLAGYVGGMYLWEIG
ncbi:MAG: hypothetical protein ACOYBE_03905 [Blautia sp.]|jgi:leader peptidase (prepilin peptidase)/N-methyltransferase